MIANVQRTQGSVLGPAIGLIVISGLGLIMSIGGFWNMIQIYRQTPMFAKDATESLDNFGKVVLEGEEDAKKKELIQNAMGGFGPMSNSFVEWSQSATLSYAVYLAVVAVLDFIILAGAISMLMLRRYGLALAGAIIAVIPLGLGCILSLPFGIWAIVVLANAENRACFR